MPWDTRINEVVCLNTDSTDEYLSDIYFRNTFEILFKWVLQDVKSPHLNREYTGRLAPSIVSRNDLELLGVSTPRFALRTYFLDLKNGVDLKGFVNLRRAKLLKNMATGNIRVHSIIGDCILPVPKYFKDKQYIVLHNDFTKEIGDEKAVGTPYVQSGFSAGCFPAVAFVAAMLLKEYISVIHSFPEIAMCTTTKNDHPGHLLLKSTSSKEMVEYFKTHVNLNVIPQSVEYDRNIPNLKRENKFEFILQTYVASKMPVILLVDYNRLLGHSDSWLHSGKHLKEFSETDIYTANLAEILQAVAELNSFRNIKHHISGKNPHAVIVVGYGKDQTRQETNFLIHDPNHLPFLNANIKQLLDARSETYVKDNTAPVFYSAMAMPVTPLAVKMPLFNETLNDEESSNLGIYTISKALQSLSDPAFVSSFFPELSDDEKQSDGEWRLVQVKNMDKLSNHELDGYFSKSPDLIANLKDKLLTYVTGEHWVWVQYFPLSSDASTPIIFWDAETESIKDVDNETKHVELLYKNYFIGSFEPLSIRQPGKQDRYIYNPYLGNIQILKKASNDISANAQTPAPSECQINNIAIISSFKTGEYAKSNEMLDEIGERNIGIELYAFMQKDVDKLVKHVLKLNEKFDSAVKFMAHCHDKDDFIQKIADDIKSSFPSNHEKQNKPIRSLATFVPEIMSPHEPQRKAGLEALKFACRLLAKLQPKEMGGGRFLEMVGGGICHGVQKIEDGDFKGEYASPLTSEADRKQFMRDCLKGLIEDIVDHDIQVVIEVEPGRMFAFNDVAKIDALMDIFNTLEKDTRLKDKKHFGLNLDIAHWMLIASKQHGNTLPWFDINSREFQYIRHAHISDSFFHLADLPLESHSSKNEIQAWVDLIKKRYNDKSGLPACSGFVSVELESAYDHRFVAHAIKKAREYFL